MYHRLVLDESSFALGTHDVEQVRRAVAELNDLLEELRAGSYPVAVWSELYEVVCREGLVLHDLLFDPERSPLGRDERTRLMQALARLPHWDEDSPSGVPLEVSVEGTPELTFAPTVGYALLAATQRFSVACAVLPLAASAGLRKVRGEGGEGGEGEVFFFSSAAALPDFWRATVTLEKPPEKEFFRRAVDAFPNLVLHPGLSFNSFDGSYQDLREQVLAVLTAINDGFAPVWDEVNGQPREVQVRMGSRGVDMSPESVKTRGSHKHMAMRDVVHNGVRFRCEWHAKLERHRNRIHFSLPDEALGNRILIGLFVDHLPIP
jgi:hypothetical protein